MQKAQQQYIDTASATPSLSGVKAAPDGNAEDRPSRPSGAGSRNLHGLGALPRGNRLHWFTIDAILGRGGFGITYLAHDENLEQQVAIKEYLPGDIAERAADLSVIPATKDAAQSYNWGLQRFITEARTLARFRHPNIVPVRMVFEANQTAYMVMDYEAGSTLSSVVGHSIIDTEAKLRCLVEPLLSGLAEVHKAGFIHRDIKPDNIILRRDSSPVLIDFGAARAALTGETRALTTLVTPHYTPFEQYSASQDLDRQGPWTDIYALCATIYRVIMGRPPIDAMTRADAVIRSQPDPYEPLCVLTPEGFSRSLCVAIDAGLAFRPEDRPQSIGALRNMLTDWRQDLPVEKSDLKAPATGFTIPLDPDDGNSDTISRAPEFLDTGGIQPRSSDHTTQPGDDGDRIKSYPIAQWAQPAAARRRKRAAPRLAVALVLLATAVPLSELALNPAQHKVPSPATLALLGVRDLTFDDSVAIPADADVATAEPAANSANTSPSAQPTRSSSKITRRERVQQKSNSPLAGIEAEVSALAVAMERPVTDTPPEEGMPGKALRAISEWLATIPTTRALPDRRAARQTQEESN